MTLLPAEYLQKKGFEYRNRSGQLVLKNCPFCRDAKGHFYMDQNEGIFFCHKCHERGNLITLQKHLGDYESQRENRYMSQKSQATIRPAFPDKDKTSCAPDDKKAQEAHERLLNDRDAIKYITHTRGISLDTVKAFQIGLQVDNNGGRWLTIPHYAKGKLINIKSRSLPPAKKAFRRIRDCRSILFNSDAIEACKDHIYITEGEIDALTLWDQGIKNVVAATTGAGSFDPVWIDQLQGIKKIILIYDPDEVGQKGAKEVARRLGYDRCFNVVLPNGQDINEFFLAEHAESVHSLFSDLVNNAHQFDVAGIMSFADGLTQYRNDLEKPILAGGLKTGWPSIDKIIKTGFMPGELIILSAPPKTGKSTFALQIAAYIAFSNIPALLFCLEMRPIKLVQKVVACHNESENIGLSEIEKTEADFKGKPLYLGYCYQKPILEEIMETLKTAIRRYGLKLVVFDHLHFLCRSISNQVQEVSLAVQAFKFLAEELEVPIILIAQPRKVQPDSIMTASDLKDSSSIFSDCDHLIILHRPRKASTSKDIKEGGTLQTEAFESVTMVRIEASRYNAGGECLLYYHGAYSRFDELIMKSR